MTLRRARAEAPRAARPRGDHARDRRAGARYRPARRGAHRGLLHLDRFERRDGAWRIAKRVCAFDWTQTLAELPEARFVFEEHFSVGRRDRDDPGYRDV